MTYRVYVIQNPSGRFYIGLSDDVQRRLADHNSGISTWTRHRGPWDLVWLSDGMSLSEARKLENLLKAQKGGDGFYRITGLVHTARSSGSSSRMAGSQVQILSLPPTKVLLQVTAFAILC